MLSLNARLGACTLALAAPLAVGAEDQEGAADPPGLARFPDSWIVAYEPPTPMRGYEFVTGRVDRSQRDRRIDSAQRIAGRLVRVTYRLPAGTRYEDVIGHYQSLVRIKMARWSSPVAAAIAAAARFGPTTYSA